MPTPGQTLDGYSLIRRIGQGGFGEVWLCRAPVTGEWRALKWVPESDGAAMGKEHEALMSYRRLTARLRSPHLMPVEHVNRSPGGLFYTMPLSSGLDGDDPESPDWTPKTLAAVIERRRARPGWFSSEEIKKIIGTVLDGLQVMADAGVVHRDVKPENVLFFGERPCLADISLLTHDRTQMTRHGTPGYSTPSWYEGGHYDMYGAAALLYTLLTGNAPDRMGRSAFTGPPCGEASLTPEERADRVRLHAVVRRAVHESASERFPDFPAMSRALSGDKIDRSPCSSRQPRVNLRVSAAAVGILALISVIVVIRVGQNRDASAFPLSRPASVPAESGAGSTQTAGAALLPRSYEAILAHQDRLVAEATKKLRDHMTELLRAGHGMSSAMKKMNPLEIWTPEYAENLNLAVKSAEGPLRDRMKERQDEVAAEYAALRALRKEAESIPKNAQEALVFEREIAPKLNGAEIVYDLAQNGRLSCTSEKEREVRRWLFQATELIINHLSAVRDQISGLKRRNAHGETTAADQQKLMDLEAIDCALGKLLNAQTIMTHLL